MDETDAYQQNLSHFAMRSQICTSALSLRDFGHRDVIATDARSRRCFLPKERVSLVYDSSSLAKLSPKWRLRANAWDWEPRGR